MANFNVDTNGNLWIGSGVSDTFTTAQNQSNTKFYVTSAGAIYAVSGHIGGIVVDANGVESSNFDSATNTGWRLDNSTGIAQYFDIDITLENTASGSPSATQRIDIGNSQIFDLGNQGLTVSTNALRSSKFKAIAIGTASNPPIAISGDHAELGFFATNSTDAGGFTTMHATNGTSDVFHWNSTGTNVTFHGNVTIEGSQISVNGDTGGNNQFLGYDGSGSLGFHTVSGSSHPDSDHTSFLTQTTGDARYYTKSINDILLNAKANSSHGTHVTFGGNGNASSVSRSDHSHASSGGVTSISSGGSPMTGAISVTGSGSGFFDAITQDTQQVKFTRSGVSSVKLRPASSTANYGLGDSTFRWLLLHSQFATNVSSDENLKENITVSDLGLDFINELEPKKFTYKRQYGWVCENTEEEVETENSECNSCDEDTDCDIKWTDITGIEEDAISYGLIAQDVEALQPDDTNWNLIRGEGDETKSLAYTELISPLIKAVQELSTQISDLTARIEVLEG